jgi:hypothetical protein
MTTPSQTQTQNQPKEKPYEIVDFLDLDTSCFTFLAPKANKHNGHFIPIRYNGKPLYVTYEARTCPFGVSESTDSKPEYKDKYPDGKKVTGYSTSISCEKDWENDPYYLKAEELDQFFIDVCYKNAMRWHLGGTAKFPLNREPDIAGRDERGVDGKWKRFLKWSYKKDADTGERTYLDYPPRLDFGIPTTNMSEYQGPDGLMVQEATFKPVFFDSEANKLESVTSSSVGDVLPNFSRLSVLAQWSTISQGGSYGASLKPKAQQFRVYPNESLATDECLLDDDGAADYEISDVLGTGDFSGATVTKVEPNANPAPLNMTEEVTEEVVELAEETIEVVGEPEPVAPPVATRPVRTRRVVTAKRN